MSNSLARYAKSAVRRFTRGDAREQTRFLLDEVSELRQLVRLLLAESPAYAEQIRQTAASFNAQWHELPGGRNLAGDPGFERDATTLVEKYSGRPAAWFAGKSVLDAGCGNGRWSYALCKLGARVTAIDISEAGLANVQQLCGSYAGFSARRHSLLEPLPFGASFDFVWNYGVDHHTGNTKLALTHAAAAVKPGGRLFTMIYGEPTDTGGFAEINTYVRLRREISAMTFDEKIAFLRARFGDELLNAWFDGLSPSINDLHRFDEIRLWLTELHFTDIRRTIENRNHHVSAVAA